MSDPAPPTDPRPALRAIYRTIAAQRADLLAIACAQPAYDLSSAIGHLDVALDWIESAARPRIQHFATAGERND